MQADRTDQKPVRHHRTFFTRKQPSGRVTYYAKCACGWMAGYRSEQEAKAAADKHGR